MSDNKTSLNKFRKIEIISSTFSDHSGMKVEISKEKYKILKYKDIKQYVSNQWVKEEIERKIKDYIGANGKGTLT